MCSVEGRDAIARCREVSPDAGGVLGQFNQEVKEQSTPRARCVDLLIPHAVTAQICAGEAVDVDDSRWQFKQEVKKQFAARRSMS
jgi:hypothetical protein